MIDLLHPCPRFAQAEYPGKAFGDLVKHLTFIGFANGPVIALAGIASRARPQLIGVPTAM
jgi:hypothetical protein